MKEKSSSSPRFLAGIDMGATNLRCALADLHQPGRILVRRRAKTPAQRGVERVLARIVETLSDCLREVGVDGSALTAIGCTAPGITDARRGIVLNASNLQGWRDIPLAHLLEQRFGASTFVENDVNAAALGEYVHGAGQGCRSLVYLTISTGVAAGIVVEGTLLPGHHHAAGELGFFLPDRRHIGKDWEGIGCLELTSAGVGLARQWVAQRGGPSSTDRAVEVFAAADAGDADALALVERSADYLAQAAVGIATLIDPEVIVLGGSIATHQPRIFDRIREVVRETVPFPPRVIHAALGGDAPLIGALMIAARHLDRAPSVTD